MAEMLVAFIIIIIGVTDQQSAVVPPRTAAGSVKPKYQLV